MEELKDPGVRYGHHKIIKDKTLLHLRVRERSSVFSKPSEYSYPAMQDREGSREPKVRPCRRSFFLL